MERDFMHGIVRTRLHLIRKHAVAGAETFDKEDIHEMRTGYKKLRAFLRLLSLDQRITIPEALKQLYRAAAPLRDLQLYRKQVKNFAESATTPYPAAYIDRLSEEIRKAGQHFAAVVKDTDFDKIKNEIDDQLPVAFSALTLGTFIKMQEQTVHEIMQKEVTADNDLHTARKHLKDVMYNIAILENEERLPGPVYDEKEKQLKGITDTLGDHNDLCVHVGRLDKDLHDWKDREDHATLQQLQLQWKEEKLVMRTLAEKALQTYS